MDLIKIGKFIQQQRKEKNLTQVQLAQKIGVSEKTISKWECGNGFPDTTLMLPLCSALSISANELLSGKLINENDEYKKLIDGSLECKDYIYQISKKQTIWSSIIFLGPCPILGIATLTYQL